MSLTTPFQSRETAMRGDYVRLFCTFKCNGILRDPLTQPQVRIVTNAYAEESTSSESSSMSSDHSYMDSSSSSSSIERAGTGWGPFYATKLHIGIWYVDWFVPEDVDLGDYFDMWYFQFETISPFEKYTFRFTVHAGDSFINFFPNAEVSLMGNTAVSMVNGLKTNLIDQATDIPVYWEQGMIVGSNKLNFAFKNWRRDQPVLLRKNNKIVDSGVWTPDFDGGAVMAGNIDPEDMFYAHYHFSYFTDDDLLCMLNEGLWALNATQPSSETYQSIANMPFVWRGGVILYAAMQALRKIIFGFTWQERAIIFGEKPEDAQRFIDNCKTLYTDYNALWMELRKEIKKKLPSISVNVTPEYTLPGGRCLSSTTYVSCRVNGIKKVMTIAELYTMPASNAIEVLSMVKDKLGFSQVSKVWKSGKKLTFALMAGGHSLRVSRDHLVFVPEANDYWPAYALRKGTNVLVEDNGVFRMARLEENPIAYQEEDVYDIEVPSSRNLLTNGIVTHNSRWFRYMYKSGS